MELGISLSSSFFSFDFYFDQPWSYENLKILLPATKLEIENLILMSLFIHIENNIILLFLFLFLII